eukprot:3511572-Rhodomonas_salina.1
MRLTSASGDVCAHHAGARRTFRGFTTRCVLGAEIGLWVRSIVFIHTQLHGASKFARPLNKP